MRRAATAAASGGDPRADGAARARPLVAVHRALDAVHRPHRHVRRVAHDDDVLDRARQRAPGALVALDLGRELGLARRRSAS